MSVVVLSLNSSRNLGIRNKDGEMSEWLKVAVSKTVAQLNVPGVQIPLSPPKQK